MRGRPPGHRGREPGAHGGNERAHDRDEDKRGPPRTLALLIVGVVGVAAAYFGGFLTGTNEELPSGRRRGVP